MLFKVIHIFHPHYHPNLIEHILKNKQKNKCVRIHETTLINHNDSEDESENKSHRHDINRPMSRHGHKYQWWIQRKNHLVDIDY